MKIYVLEESYLPFLNVNLFTHGDFIFTVEGHTVSMYSVISTEKHFDVDNGTLEFLYKSDSYQPSVSFDSGKFIFEVSGADKRKGDSFTLNFLKNYFNDAPVINFLDNAVDILNYKKDQLDAMAIIDLFKYKILKIESKPKDRKPKQPKTTSIKEPVITTPKETKVYKPLTPIKIELEKPVSTYQAKGYVFFDYLSAGCRDLWKKKEKEGKELREIFGFIMSERKDEYRQSIKSFLKDNPTLSIYSLKEEKKNDAPKKQDSKKEYKRCSGFDFIYSGLEKRGYEQISDTEWVNKLGERYVIDIHELTDKSMLYSSIDEDEEVNETFSIKELNKDEKINETTSTKSFDENDMVILADSQEEIPEETESIEESKEEAVEEEAVEEVKKMVNPKSNILTGYDISRLRYLFKHTQTSYKYLWFCSILQNIKNQSWVYFSCDDMAIDMLVLAWPYCEKIKYPSDRLPYWKRKIIEHTDITSDSNPIIVRSALNREARNPFIFSLLKDVTRIVIFRFLSVWIEQTSEKTVIQQSQAFYNNCIYKIGKSSRGYYITVNPIWKDFLIKYNTVLYKYSYENFKKSLDYPKGQAPVSDTIFPMQVFNFVADVPVFDLNVVGSRRDKVYYLEKSLYFNNRQFLIAANLSGYYLWHKDDGYYYLSGPVDYGCKQGLILVNSYLPKTYVIYFYVDENYKRLIGDLRVNEGFVEFKKANQKDFVKIPIKK